MPIPPKSLLVQKSYFFTFFSTALSVFFFATNRRFFIFVKKKLLNKNDALKFEYSLKKNIKLRKKIKEKFINEYSNSR